MGIETLNEDLELNIPMFDDDMDIIAKLDDEPNAVGGLTAAELKAEFDRPGKTIQEYLNKTLIPSLIGTVAEESVRAQNEYIRVTNENQRVANENGRVEEEERRNTAELERIENEDSRGDNETKRVQAETARAAAEAQRKAAEQAREDKTSGIVAQATEQANEAKNQAERAEGQANKAGDEADRAAEQANKAKNEADRAAEQANLARQVKSMQAEATTLSAGSEATAKVEEENGDLVLRVGIPVGRDGKDGQDGQAGPAGADGQDGVTFTPSVSSAGVLSWSNDGGKQNPSSVNIKGPAGADGVGIKSVVQTELSTEDQGRNTMRVTKTDGTTTDFYVFNGRRGSTGPVGQPGKDGRNGAPGKSAYEYAKDGGFTGTEEEFAELLANGNGGGADWDQNDPEGAGYVKGRTHWYDEDGFHPLNGRFLPDSVPWVENYATDILSCEVVLDGNGEAKLDVRPEIFEGGKYMVSWNGAEYDCEAMAFEENGAYIGMAIGSGDPFIIILVTEDMVETVGSSFLIRGTLDYARTVVDLRISKRGIYYQKLQKELLPDDVPFVYATKQSLTEEQKAQARDNIGVENVLESVGGDTLTWDGNTEGLATLDYSGDGSVVLAKVSDAVPTLQELSNGCTVNTIDGEIPLEASENSPGIILTTENLVAFVSEEGVGVNLGGKVFPEAGTYFINYGDGFYIQSLTIPGYTGFAKKKIKEEYIPESVPNIQTAAVGQTIVVSEVDKNGKPTKWEARDAGAGGGVDSYADLKGKPSINGVELTGNKTSADLGIGNPTNEQVSAAVSSWLDEHPEATTSVPDGSIGPEKTTWLNCVYTNEYNTADADAQDGYFFYSDSNADTTGGGTAAYNVSGFIPVVAGKQYCFNYIRKAKWLDSSKAYIATIDCGNAPDRVFVAPENASYVRFDVTSANKEKAFFYEYLGEFHDYSAYHTERVLRTNDPSYDSMLAESVRDMFANGAVSPERTFPTESVGFKQLTGFEEFHWNIVSPDFVERGTLSATGVEDNRVDSGNIVYRRTTFIPVEAGEEYHAIGFNILLYDGNKNYISSFDLVAGKGKFIVPENGAYIRCWSSRSDGTEPTFPIIRRGYGRNDLNYTSEVDYLEYVPVFKNENARKGFAIHLGVNPWVDKKFCFIGDSFSAPGVWQGEMCSRLLASPAGNKAVSGGRWSDTTGAPCAYEQAQGFVSDGFTPDVIFCMLGVNDANNAVQLGDIVESTEIADFDMTTYTGSMQACLNYLQNNFPDAAIFVGWTPAGANCNFASGDVVEPYIERMKEICLMYGVRYLETRACGITKYSAAYADCFESGTGGGHPTNAGHVKIGEYMSRLI